MTATGGGRRFEIGDEVVCLEPFGPPQRQTKPGDKGTVFNVFYGDGKTCCLSISRCPEDHLRTMAIHWDRGMKMGLACWNDTFWKIKVTARPRELADL